MSGRAGWSRSAQQARSGSDGGRGRTAGDRHEEIAELEQRDEEAWEGLEQPQAAGLAGGIGDRPGGRGDAAAAVRGGGRSAVPLGLEEAGAAARGEWSTHDPRSGPSPSPSTPRPRSRPRPSPGRMPERRLPEVSRAVAPRRFGVAGARLLGRRLAPARDEPRLFFQNKTNPAQADRRKEQPPWSATCRSDPVDQAHSDPSTGPQSSGDTDFPVGMPRIAIVLTSPGCPSHDQSGSFKEIPPHARVAELASTPA